MVARHEEAVQETLGLLAAGFRERQVKKERERERGERELVCVYLLMCFVG